MSWSNEHKEYLKKIYRKKKLIISTQLLILFLVFALWEIAGNLGWVDPFLTSTPSRMIKSLAKIYSEGTLFKHIATTCFETILGFLIGTLLGTIISILLWWSDFINKVLDPYLVVLNALPKVSLAPIIIFWVGNGLKAIIFIAILISIITTIITILNGFMRVDIDKIRLLRTFGATKLQILYHLIIPSSIPTIISALKISVGLSWVGVIMGEFLVAREGLGFLIIYGGQISQLDMVMMSIIILAILAFIMYQGVAFIEKKLISRYS